MKQISEKKLNEMRALALYDAVAKWAVDHDHFGPCIPFMEEDRGMTLDEAHNILDSLINGRK